MWLLELALWFRGTVTGGRGAWSRPAQTLTRRGFGFLAGITEGDFIAGFLRLAGAALQVVQVVAQAAHAEVEPEREEHLTVGDRGDRAALAGGCEAANIVRLVHNFEVEEDREGEKDASREVILVGVIRRDEGPLYGPIVEVVLTEHVVPDAVRTGASIV